MAACGGREGEHERINEVFRRALLCANNPIAPLCNMRTKVRLNPSFTLAVYFFFVYLFFSLLLFSDFVSFAQ
jgi:hypothetical protein